MDSLMRKIARLIGKERKKIVVLDDDPTGVQTVHGIRVLTRWDEKLLTEAFHDHRPLFYILTNTRSLGEAEVVRIHREIVARLIKVSQMTGTDFVIASRSDSTLRGHYPLEIDVLAESLYPFKKIDGHLIVPAFFEGGRITRENTHYMVENGRLIPVNQTEFAKDPVFGFTQASLPHWIEEKSKGKIKAEDTVCISLDDIRTGGYKRVFDRLMEVKNGLPVVVNAVDYDDLLIFVHGLILAEQSGKNFIYRTAASFVKVRGSIRDKPLLRSEDVHRPEKLPGIVLVGSYVNKTSEQLEHLVNTANDFDSFEADVSKLLRADARAEEIGRILNGVNQSLGRNRDVVVYTSRNLVKGEGKSENLLIGLSVSQALVEIVRGLRIRPGFMIAKGGITSSDIATEGLNIQAAEVIGQVAKGVPVWLCGSESKFPGMPYVVFPGNVGTAYTLSEVFQTFRQDKEQHNG